MKRKLEVDAEEEETIEPEVMVETLEELEATEVGIEKEASEEEEVETVAAKSQKMRNQNLKSELRTPLPKSETTDLRNFLSISSNNIYEVMAKWGEDISSHVSEAWLSSKICIWGDFIDSIQIGSMKTAEIEPNLNKNLEPDGL